MAGGRRACIRQVLPCSVAGHWRAHPNRAGGRDQACAERRGRSNLSAADFDVVDAFETVIECRFDAFCGEQDECANHMSQAKLPRLIMSFHICTRVGLIFCWNAEQYAGGAGYRAHGICICRNRGTRKQRCYVAGLSSGFKRVGRVPPAMRTVPRVLYFFGGPTRTQVCPLSGVGGMCPSDPSIVTFGASTRPPRGPTGLYSPDLGGFSPGLAVVAIRVPPPVREATEH